MSDEEQKPAEEITAHEEPAAPAPEPPKAEEPAPAPAPEPAPAPAEEPEPEPDQVFDGAMSQIAQARGLLKRHSAALIKGSLINDAVVLLEEGIATINKLKARHATL